MRDAFPLLLSQRAVYIQCQASGESTQYNLPFCYSYGQTVTPERLADALRKAMSIHSGLRMRLTLDEQGDVLQYPDPDELKIDTLQLTQSEFEEWKSHWMRPFDLLGEPLVRVTIVLVNDQVFLFWDAHHIVSDGASHMAFNATLDDILHGRTPTREAVDLKQAVAIECQRTLHQRREEDLVWYDMLLSGCETTTLCRRPDKVDSRLDTVTSVVDSEPVDDLCNRAEVPPSTFFMSALSLCLANWSQVNTVQMCVVNHGRWDKTVARTSGMFVRTLPVVVDVKPERTTTEFVRTNRQLLRELWMRQSIPLGELLDRYGLSMEVSYSWQGFYGSSIGGAESLEKMPLTQPLRPLSVQVFVEEGKYIVKTEYDTSCFRRGDMESFADALVTCLNSMVRTPDKMLGSIDIVSADAKKELLTLGRGRSLDYDKNETFLNVFERNVKYDPEKTAVVAENGSLSWRQLDQQSSLLAEELVMNGAGRGVFICIMLPRIKEYMVATLGVFKSDAAYVPLDPEYPNDRLLYMLRDSQTEILITTRKLFEEKNVQGEFNLAHVVFLDEWQKAKQAEAGGSNSVRRFWELPFPSPEDAAYMIYTSGSTGKPKGVVIRHKSLLSYLAGWKGTVYEIRRDDVICCAFSFSFDASVSNLYGSLYAGATLHIVSSRVRMDLSLLNRYIQAHGITAAKFPTQLGMELFEQYAPDLRFAIFGGETMKPIRRCQTQLVNGYGPTEFTVNATFHPVDQAKDTGMIPIGRPVPNSRAFIVGRAGRLVPRGAVGELCFAGRQIAREYWNRPDLTMEKFIVNPWSDDDDEDIAMYRTGDLARWNEDGDLECLGRIDHQVKLRGFRIELGEIESVLSQYPSIRSCVVVVRELGTTQHLCAYYVSDRDIDDTHLRNFLAASLTEYMVPTAYMRLEEMPLTPNGKIDRKLLPEPKLQATDLVLPATSREQQLVDLTIEVLGVSAFGVTTNLMSIGLTSMSAIRLATQIQKRLGWPIATRDVLRHSTIRELVRLAEGDLSQHGPYPLREEYPLASNQEGLYVEWRLYPESTQYNHPECYRFTAVDPDRLRDAVEHVIDAHPILKSRISTGADDRPVWIRRDDESCKIEVVRLRKEPGFDFFQSRIRPFDLESESPCRVTICHSPRGVSLFVDVHHIAFDGVSADIFWDELSRCFSGQTIDREQFTAFDESLYEVQRADKIYNAAAARYFSGLLTGVSTTELPALTPVDGASRAGRAERTLVRGEVARFCRENSLTENSLFMTAVALVLRRFCSVDDVQFVTVSSGRSHPELESTIGMFVKTLPVVLPAGKGTLLDHAGKLQRQLLETLDYDLYPYSQLVSQFGLSSQIAYIWQERFGRKVELDGQSGERIDFHASDPKFPFSIEIVPCGDWYRVATEYDASIYAERDAKMFLDALCQFVASATQDESGYLDGDLIDVVSPSERKELLRLSCGGNKVVTVGRTSGGTGRLRLSQQVPEANLTFLEVFEQHVAMSPDESAVVAYDGRLNYSQLDAAAQSLAGQLRKKGVLPGTFVCVMFERSISFAVGVLAIFKAGAAYVPLDVSYPNERLLYMLKDSDAQVLLTTRPLYEQKQFGDSFDESKVLFVDELIVEDAASKTEEYPTAFNERRSCDAIPCAKASDPAYMIYTSGSTGRPKGVVVSICSLVAYLSSWQGTRFEPKPGERFCCYPSFSFDASIDDLLGPLYFGATSCIVPERIRRDVESLTDWLNDEKITAGSFPAQIGTVLLGQSNLSLRYVRLGGEKFVLPNACNVEVLNVYGPTEFTVCCSWHVVNREKDRHGIPIGRPVRGCRCYVLSSQGALLPRGAYGELCLTGRQLSNGYWRRPELTSQRFVVNPLSEGADDKLMYRTGDLVRWNDEGELEYCGRADNQIKLRGFRIEPGEIESVLGEYPGMVNVAVAVKTVGASVALCAYYKSTDEVDEERLRAFLADHLTEYMVPSAFIRLDAFPLSPSGKIDRDALPIPQSLTPRVYVEPQTPEQSALVQVFGEILHVEKVGIDDGFFTLGGDSIKAIRAVSRLRQLGFQTNVAVIMRCKTAREIARETFCVKANDEMDCKPVEGIVPLTYVQRYFLDLGMPNPNHFNQSVLLECEQRIDEGALRRSLDAMVSYHDMLRVRLIDGVQTISPIGSTRLLAFSVCDLTKESKWRGIMSRKAGQAQRGLSLSKGPLVAAVLFRTPDKDYLLLVIHHFVVDGVSWRILTEDLQTLYGQSVAGGQAALPPKTASFKSWSQAVEIYRESEALASELPYWTRVQDLLATGKQRCRSKGVFHFLEKNLGRHTTHDLLGPASAAYSTGANDLLCAAVCRAFVKVFDKSQVAMQMEGHGREEIDCGLSIDRTVGWFTSAWPVVFDVDVNNIRTSIRGVKETLRRVPNHGVGYGILQYIGTAELKRDVAADISFNYLGELDEGGTGQFFRMNHDLPQGVAMADGNRFGPPLGLVCQVRNGELTFRLAYDSNLLAKKDCEAFLRDLIVDLTEIRDHCLGVSEPEQTASDLGELQWSEEEFSEVMETFASRDATIRRIYPLTPMQEGFLFHRLSDPDSSAYVLQKVYACDCTLTRQEVAEAVDRLALCHEVLRTSIIYKGVEPARQAIVDGRPFEVSFCDLSGCADQDAEIAEMMKADLRRGFDLQDDPLFRVAVIRTGPKSTRLLVTQHHIIVDGWCIGILTKDFERFLSEAVSRSKRTSVSRKTTLTDTPAVSTCSFETAVRKILAFDTGRALDYWKSLLADCETVSEIPDYVSKRNKSHSDQNESEAEEPSNVRRGNLGVYTFDEKATNAIDELCRHLDITPNTVFEAALGLLLQTYSRSRDVVFGKVVSGRTLPLPGIEKTVGVFINTIPVRVKAQAEETGAALLTQLQSQAAASARYDRCALSDIMAGHDLGADLIKTVFAFENYFVEPEQERLPIRLVPVTGGEETNYDVSFLTHKKADLYEIVVMCRVSCFEPEMSDRLANLFGLLVKCLATRSDDAISTFELVDERNRKDLLTLARGAEPDHDRDELFLDSFARQVATFPDQTAVVAKNGSLTYRELNDLSDRLACKFVESGVAAGSFICVMLERTTWFMVATIAAFKAGCAYVPLDSDYPSERLAHMLQDSSAGVLVTSREQYEQKRRQGLIAVPVVLFVPEVDSPDCVFTDETTNGSHSGNGHAKTSDGHVMGLPRSFAAETPAYMIYTSGSTGKPKGVVVSHGALAAYLSWNRRLFALTSSDCVCCHPSFSFDASVDSLFGPLLVGGEVHIVPETLRQDLRLLCDYLIEQKISGGTFSTQLGMELLNYGKAPLRFVFLGGEKLNPVQRCDTKIVNGYGPTEFTVCSDYHVVNQEIDTDDIPIGRPVPGSWSYVLDSAGRLLPRGVPGELCISGRQLASGYWNRPELTAEKFVDNPFAENSDSRRYYRTGDLVRWNATGELEYLGRIDTQVKIRGFRIELGEVESAISRYPGVLAACADVRTIGSSPQLVAWFVASEQINVEKLRDWLSEKLTDYMLPSLLVQLDRIPLTPNGKVDRKVLKVPTIKREQIVQPRDAIERRMYEAAVRILGSRAFGVTTNLFSAGMTSMTGIRFAAAIQDIPTAAGLKNETPITYADIFKYQTIERLARLASGRIGELSIQYHLEDVSRFDYAQIETLLKNNSLPGVSSAGDLLTGHYENVLLTGATGFLGVHVLAAFLERFSGKVYCLVRRSKDHKIAQRLLQYLFFYFDRSYAEELGNRLCVVEGDITDRDGLLALDLGVTHVINCAANVKHFSEGDDIHRINFCGVENLIEYCRKFGSKLIHVSTVSIAGSAVADTPLAMHPVGEDELFVGQTLDNKYIHSKFLAERAIFAAIASNEIAGKVMRAGNLMPRASDGVFQMNAASNSFAKRLKAYKLLGVYPISRLAAPVELSPIDETARVLLTLGLVNDRFTLFHLYNNHSLSMGDVIGAMNRYGFGIRPVSDGQFASRLADAAKNEKMVENLSGIIAYQRDRVAAVTVPVATTSAFTATVQYCLAEDWTLLARDYLTNMIDQLNGLGFFDERF